MIQIQHLSKKYGQNIVLDDITFTFEKGKVYGIVGENGAGKTTLFRCIAQMENFTGNIHADLTPLRNFLGYVMAESYFMSKVTGEEYIQLLLEAKGRKKVDIAPKNFFGLPLQQFVENYSTGMRKKLILTAVLLQDTPYLILDEPYNGLDLSSSLMLSEIIGFLKEKGKTIILSSHILSSMQETCDEIILLERGKLSAPIDRAHFSLLEENIKSKLIPASLKEFF